LLSELLNTLEGAMVAIAVALIPVKTSPLEEILTIALIAAATFSLDMFAPSMVNPARLGAGFGNGAGLAQFPARPM
jgi:hypothetical protein